MSLLVREPFADESNRDLEEMEMQVFRMQDDIKRIAKKWDVVGIDHSKEDNLVIVYKHEEEERCNIMINDCESAFRGVWDFAVQALFPDRDRIHIGDIKGPENKGYGSICIDYLKELAQDKNIPYITGDISERDWDHLERLIHFYEKHNFTVDVDYEEKWGHITWKQGH
ncbi:hypothetical protein [Pseudalkalibacillus berkeleyi]|uniref:GNAT family N-acetyltransferase n=1 Tax=Pseudalkalibacillus berkeleyi TaxID=1069813 RepID=A0ABS9H0V9_9BACL|nr:hypothetical protein [Pseudalkalibacillus berkeleyi]MCF6137408.1 hypothetical protein [Pseudalkalibacillus berkeleyi]